MKVYPSLSEYFKYVQSAETEDPRARGIKKLFDTLKKAMQINSRIVGHFSTRTTALSSFDWNLIGDFNKIEEIINRNKTLINYLINNHTYTAMFGATLYKLCIINNELGSQLFVEKKYDNSEFDYNLDSLYLYDTNGSFTEEISLIENEYHLLNTIQYYSKGGILRSIMPIEIIRFDMILENANWLRKLKGILQIVNKGSSPENERAAEQAAQTAVSNNYLISDDLIEFKLNEIAGSGGTVFKDFIDFINKEISIAILGQANTSELPNGGGSRAALQIQSLISADIFYADMIRMEEFIDKILLLDYKNNYDKLAVIAPYKFKFSIAEEQDIERNAAALKIINEFLPVLKKEAYQFINFTVPSKTDLEEDILQPNKSAF
jgi:phage gp29-like protein